MALPTSGPLSIGQIRTELGSSSGSLRTLSAAAGKSTPDSISEFYGYSAYTVPTLSGVSYSGSGTQSSPYVFTIPTTGTYSNIPFACNEEYAGSPESVEINYFRYTTTSARPTFTNKTVADQTAHVTATAVSQSGYCTTYNYAYFSWNDGPVRDTTNLTYIHEYSQAGQSGPTRIDNALSGDDTWSITGYYATLLNQTWDMNIQSLQSLRRDYYLYCEYPEGGIWYTDYYCNQVTTNFTLTLSVWFELT